MTFKEACSTVADLFEAIPETWVAHQFARDASGIAVDPRAPEACAWCAVGGVRAALDQGAGFAWEELDPIAKKLGYEDAAIASDIDRLIAIKLLRMAAGEIK